MTDADARQLTKDIINQALEGKFIEFRYIRAWREFRYYNQTAVSTKLVIKTLKTSAKNLFKSYCRDVIAGISDVHKLIAYTQLLDIIAFYQKDLDTLKRMLDDYKDYLSQGNFWYSFWGGYRNTWDKYC